MGTEATSLRAEPAAWVQPSPSPLGSEPLEFSDGPGSAETRPTATGNQEPPGRTQAARNPTRGVTSSFLTYDLFMVHLWSRIFIVEQFSFELFP